MRIVFFILLCCVLNVSIYAQNNYTSIKGNKQYELSNYLGNVLVTVSDRNVVSQSYDADIITAQDYYPFGMLIPYRNIDSTYRFGFQGQENDNEIKGVGNIINYDHRIYDSRTARFYSIDPLFKKSPYNTPYAFSENRVIDAVDSEGLTIVLIQGAGRLGAIGGFNGATGIMINTTTGDVTGFANVGLSAGLYIQGGYGLSISVMFNADKFEDLAGNTASSFVILEPGIQAIGGSVDLSFGWRNPLTWSIGGTWDVPGVGGGLGLGGGLEWNYTWLMPPTLPQLKEAEEALEEDIKDIQRTLDHLHREREHLNGGSTNAEGERIYNGTTEELNKNYEERSALDDELKEKKNSLKIIKKKVKEGEERLKFFKENKDKNIPGRTLVPWESKF